MTRDEYKQIAEEAVSIILSIGCYGLHPDRQRELWQHGLNMDRKLHPSFPKVTVWTEEEGDIDPPRREPRKGSEKNV